VISEVVKQLGDGEIVEVSGGKKLFKLSSYTGNPVVRPDELGLVWNEDGVRKWGAVFNGGAEVYNGRVVLLPRCHRDYKEGRFFDERLGIERVYLENYFSEVWPLESEDGVSFRRIDSIAIKGDGSEHDDFRYGIEDIRIIKMKDRYILMGCGKIKPPFRFTDADRIAIYSTEDFRSFTYHGIVSSFDSRNAVCFPEPVNGKLHILLRFYPNIHIATLEGGVDQLLNPRSFEKEWEKLYQEREKTLLFSIGDFPHEKEKLGPGTQLIKTTQGWLMIYHAVGEITRDVREQYGIDVEVPRAYSICAALLDLEDPSKVISRTEMPVYAPNAPYEFTGNEEFPVDVPYVVFPVGAVVVDGKLMIYAGAGDKYVVLLSAGLDKIVNHLLDHCRV